MEALLDKLPLAFEANAGQFDKRAKYRVRGHRQDLFLAAEGMVLVLEKPGSSDPLLTIVRLEFEGGAQDTEFVGMDRLPAITNYFSAGRSVTDVPNFARVRQLGVYPGIDVIYYGNRGRLEYDFMIFPGAEVNSIALRLRGHEAASVSESGDLILATRAGELKLHKPVWSFSILAARRRAWYSIPAGAHSSSSIPKGSWRDTIMSFSRTTEDIAAERFSVTKYASVPRRR